MTLRALLRRTGFDVQRYPRQGPLEYHLRTLGIQTVIDVGANEGRFARGLRDGGFRGRIISFEPIAETFARLQEAAAGDRSWECHPFALGDADADATITVAESTEFSSFLPIESFVQALHPTATAARQERVKVRTLDGLFDQLRLDDQKLWLKSDTQGFEKLVLEGARQHLGAFEGVQLELSLRPIYEGQPSFEEMVQYMRTRGFLLSDLLRGFSNHESWELFEVDGLFVNHQLAVSERPAPDGSIDRRP
jgi:FkbM family methyltransferase